MGAGQTCLGQASILDVRFWTLGARIYAFARQEMPSRVESKQARRAMEAKMRCGRRLAARIHWCVVCLDGAKAKEECLDQHTDTNARGSEQSQVARHAGVFTKAETLPQLMNLGIDVYIDQARATRGAQLVALPMRTKSQWIEGHGYQCWRIRLSPTTRET
jgi:nucleotide-binding universal stress UspA family protein